MYSAAPSPATPTNPAEAIAFITALRHRLNGLGVTVVDAPVNDPRIPAGESAFLSRGVLRIRTSATISQQVATLVETWMRVAVHPDATLYGRNLPYLRLVPNEP